jgi:hypothetical protein
MRGALVLICLALTAAGCGQDEEQAAAPTPGGGAALAQLTVTVDEDGDGAAKPKVTDLRCESSGDSKACRAVAGVAEKAFAPTPGNTACTELYGGPEVATVKGTLRGKPVDARFSRENGCEIARWKLASRLLGAPG